MKKIRLFAFVLAICILLSSTVFAAGNFSDVSQDHWAYENIQKAASLGIIQGYAPDADGSVRFNPSGSVTVGAGYVMVQRTMVVLGLLEEADPIESGTPVAARSVIAIYAAEKMGYNLSPMATLKYTDASDVAQSDAFYIDALYRYGIMQGYTDGSFGPATTINRAQFAAICIRMAELQLGGLKSQEITNLVGTISNINAETGEFTLVSQESTYRCLLATGSTLYIDGEISAFEDLAALEGKTVCTGCIAGTDSVLISSSLKITEAEISDIKENGDFTSFKANGAVYYADSDTKGTISAGEHQFIAEANHIIEFK